MAVDECVAPELYLQVVAAEAVDPVDSAGSVSEDRSGTNLGCWTRLHGSLRDPTSLIYINRYDMFICLYRLTLWTLRMISTDSYFPSLLLRRAARFRRGAVLVLGRRGAPRRGRRRRLPGTRLLLLMLLLLLALHRGGAGGGGERI